MKEYTNENELDKLAILWTTPNRDVLLFGLVMRVFLEFVRVGTA